MKENELSSAILLCGEQGQRFAEITSGKVPKSLVEVIGKPLIQYSVESLPDMLFPNLIFAVDHHSDKIREWVSKTNLPHNIFFSYQEKPGILNAVKCAINLIDADSNALCNTDEIREGLNIEMALKEHKRCSTLCTIVATYSDHLHRHGVIKVREKDSKVSEFLLKPEEYLKRPDDIGLIYTGIMIIDHRAIEYFDPNHDKNWMGIITPLCEAGEMSAYIEPALKYFNVGTKEEYQEATEYLRNKSSQGKRPQHNANSNFALFN